MSEQTRHVRKQVWIHEFQTMLFWRISLYLGVTLGCLIILTFTWALLTEKADEPLSLLLSTLYKYAPVLVLLLILMPVMLCDALRFSHRLVGPLVRFRRTMQAIAAEQPVQPFRLRRDDFLNELRDDFNRMLEALERQGVPVLHPPEPPKDEPKPSIG